MFLRDLKPVRGVANFYIRLRFALIRSGIADPL